MPMYAKAIATFSAVAFTLAMAAASPASAEGLSVKGVASTVGGAVGAGIGAAVGELAKNVAAGTTVQHLSSDDTVKLVNSGTNNHQSGQRIDVKGDKTGINVQNADIKALEMKQRGSGNEQYFQDIGGGSNSTNVQVMTVESAKLENRGSGNFQAIQYVSR